MMNFGKHREKSIRKGILLSLLLAALVLSASHILERKDSIERFKSFFDKRGDFDVLFFGTSHVVDDIYPMELWKDYGITSYNCGGDGNRLPTSYWMMLNCLNYATPEVVVIDGYWLSQNIKTSNQYSETHLSFDAFPLTATKIKAVYDLLDDPYYDQQGFTITEKREPIGLLWDFSVYHSRWNELTGDDLKPQISPEFGAASKVGYTPAGEITPVPADDSFQGNSVGIEYLERMIAECQKRGIRVLLTYLPFPAGEEYWREANRLYEIADEYGIPYINFLPMDIVNYETDTYDTNSHLNPSGAKKVTDYLGSFLSETMEVQDHRGNQGYKSWDEYYENYEKYKQDLLRAYTTFEYSTQMLADRHYCLDINVYNTMILKDQRVRENLENLGVSVDEMNESMEDNYGGIHFRLFPEENQTGSTLFSCTIEKVQGRKESNGCDIRITAERMESPGENFFGAEYWFEEDEEGILNNVRTEVDPVIGAD